MRRRPGVVPAGAPLEPKEPAARPSLLATGRRAFGAAAGCRPWPRSPEVVTAVVVTLALLAWLPRVLDRVDPVTGDEPDYLMTTIALTEGGTLDQRASFAARLFERLGYPDLQPRPSATRRDGFYSPHAPGLPALIALPYAFGGRPVVLVTFALVAALLAANITLLARRYTASGALAGVIGGLLSLTNPLASYSILIYPEVLAALCVLYPTRRVLAPRNAGWQWFAIGGCLALLPWLHYRFALVALTIAVVAAVRHRRAITRRDCLAALSLPLPSAAALAGLLTYLYGRPLPAGEDYRGFVGIGGTIQGLVATLLDRQSGVLTYNSLLVLALAAAASFAVRRRADALTLGAVALPYIALISTYREWWGGWGPPGRLSLAVVPLAAAPLAWGLASVPRRLRWPILVAFAVPALAAMATIAVDPNPLRVYGGNLDGRSPLVATWSRWTGLPLVDLLPSFIESAPSSLGYRVRWSVGAVAVLALLAVAGHRLMLRGEAAAALPAPAVPPRPWDPLSRVRRAIVLTANAGDAAGTGTWIGSRWFVPALVTVAYGVATVVMTWPYAARLGSATAVGPDPLLQIWLARWIQHALVTAPLRLFQANIFYPFADTLAYTDANIPGALFAAPLYALTGDPIATNGLLTLGTFLLAAGGMYALVGHLTGNRAVGFLCGLAYAFVPYRFVRLWHLNQLEHAWTPWLLLVLLLLIAHPTRRRAVTLVLLLAVQGLTSFYLAFQAALVVGVVLVVAVASDPRARAPRFWVVLAATGALVGLAVVPLYLPYLAVRDRQGLERTLDEAEFWKATPGAYLTTQPWHRPSPLPQAVGVSAGDNRSGGLARHADGHRHLELVIEDALFPGTATLLGAAVGIVAWRRRPIAIALVLIGAGAFVLSLGPSLGPIDGSGTTLPYKYLFEHVPFFKAMRVPARLGALVIFALVALAGCGADAAWRWLAAPRSAEPGSRIGVALRRARAHRRSLAAFGTAAIALLILGDLHATPIPLEAVDRRPEIAAPYEWLARQPGNDPVMEFPADSLVVGQSAASARRHAGLAMYWSTLHWKPIVNGVSGFQPQANALFLDAFIGDLPRADGSVARRVSHVGPETVGLLQQLGVRYVVVHRSRYAVADWPAVAEQLDRSEGDLEREGDFGEATVYVVKPPRRPSPAATITLHAPRMVAPGLPWEPRLIVANSGPRPTLYNLDRPAALAVTWFDEDGRALERITLRPKLPVIAQPGWTNCSVDGCQDASTGDRPEGRATVANPAFRQPVEPGNYTVRLDLTGAATASCTVAVTIGASVPPPQLTSWWACAGGADDPRPVLIEESWASIPALLTVNRYATIATNFISPTDGEIRAWFYLSRPGEPEPWRRYAHKSELRQRLVRAGDPTEFGWVEPLDVADGVYDLTVWFHRRQGEEWVHELGGNLGLGRVTIARDRPAAGPYQLVPWEAPAPAPPGGHATVRLAVLGSSVTATCRTTWTLRGPTDPAVGVNGKVLASGQTWDCGVLRAAIPSRLAPGRYRLEIVALATDETEVRRSDQIEVEIVVADWPGW